MAKVLKPEAQWERTQRRAIDEALAMAVARSPSIVHVHDTFVYKGAYIIVSERCHTSVREMLSMRDINPNIWFSALAKTLLNGLHWMHVNGIAHCDVHPGNVFVQFKPDALEELQATNSIVQFKLGDLGLARTIDNMMVEGTFLDAWRPPEAINPDLGPIDYRADIYQAGLVLLSFLLQEELRFSHAEILEGRPRELAEAQRTPRGAVVAEMLRRHVESRTPTALDVWRRLQPVLQLQ